MIDKRVPGRGKKEEEECSRWRRQRQPNAGINNSKYAQGGDPTLDNGEGGSLAGTDRSRAKVQIKLTGPELRGVCQDAAENSLPLSFALDWNKSMKLNIKTSVATSTGCAEWGALREELMKINCFTD